VKSHVTLGVPRCYKTHHALGEYAVPTGAKHGGVPNTQVKHTTECTGVWVSADVGRYGTYVWVSADVGTMVRWYPALSHSSDTWLYDPCTPCPRPAMYRRNHISPAPGLQRMHATQGQCTQHHTQ
jgi:hypothetical protein